MTRMELRLRRLEARATPARVWDKYIFSRNQWWIAAMDAALDSLPELPEPQVPPGVPPKEVAKWVGTSARENDRAWIGAFRGAAASLTDEDRAILDSIGAN